MADIVLYGLFCFLVAFALMLCLYFVSKEILEEVAQFPLVETLLAGPWEAGSHATGASPTTGNSWMIASDCSGSRESMYLSSIVVQRLKNASFSASAASLVAKAVLQKMKDFSQSGLVASLSLPAHPGIDIFLNNKMGHKIRLFLEDVDYREFEFPAEKDAPKKILYAGEAIDKTMESF